MNMYRTDDPIADFNRHETEQQKWLNKLPECDCCCEPIQSEHCFVLHGEIYCEECMENFRRFTEDYMD